MGALVVGSDRSTSLACGFRVLPGPRIQISRSGRRLGCSLGGRMKMREASRYRRSDATRRRACRLQPPRGERQAGGERRAGRSRRPTSVLALVGLALGLLLHTASGQTDLTAAEEDRRTEIWESAEPELLRYMKESMMFVAYGHEVAYTSYIDWYVNIHLPEQRDAPAVETIFTYLVERVLLGAGALLPFRGVFIVDLLVDLTEDAYAGLARSLETVHSSDGLVAALDRQSALLRASLVALPDEFERTQPTMFEDAMFVYYHEGVETPGIHAASEHRIGSETRHYLANLGFPEPTGTTTMVVAEALLVPMVHETFLHAYGDTGGILEPWQVELDARIRARRILYPDYPSYFCEDAWQLGFFGPEECR